MPTLDIEAIEDVPMPTNYKHTVAEILRFSSEKIGSMEHAEILEIIDDADPTKYEVFLARAMQLEHEEVEQRLQRERSEDLMKTMTRDAVNTAEEDEAREAKRKEKVATQVRRRRDELDKIMLDRVTRTQARFGYQPGLDPDKQRQAAIKSAQGKARAKRGVLMKKMRADKTLQALLDQAEAYAMGLTTPTGTPMENVVRPLVDVDQVNDTEEEEITFHSPRNTNRTFHNTAGELLEGENDNEREAELYLELEGL